jgi:hypothetical protein
VNSMAAAAEKAPSPAPVNIPSEDGLTDPLDEPSTNAPAAQLALTERDHDGDTVMAATNAGAPPTPDASPPASQSATNSAGPVPLDSNLRQVPIHPSLPTVKVPATAHSSAINTNPVTLQPFTDSELVAHGYEKLRAQILATAENQGAGGGLSERQKEEIARIQEETVVALKQRLDEREAKAREIDREMEEKEKIREVERKVFRKKMASGKDG